MEHVREITEGIQSEEAMKASNELYRSLLSASISVLEERKFETAVHTILDLCKKWIGPTIGYVEVSGIDRHRTERFFLESGGNIRAAEPEMSVPIVRLREKAYKTGRVTYDNVLLGSIDMGNKSEQLVRIDNMMFSPMNAQGKTIGVIGLANKEQGFSEQDADIAAASADIAAIALHNSRTLEKLVESEEMYRLLVENSGDVIFTLGPDFRFTYASPTVEGLTGYTAEEMMEMNLNDIFVSSSARIVSDAYRRRIRDEKAGMGDDVPERWELEHHRKDGSTVWGEVTTKPFRNKNGRFMGIQGITRDISERKRAEAALMNSEQELRILVDSSFDAIISLDPQLRLTRCNPSFLAQFGYTEEEVIGKVIAFAHPDRESFLRFGKEVYPIVHEAGYWRGEWEYLSKGGNRFVMETVLSAQRSSNGAVSGYTVVMRDLTERKRAEEEKARLESQLRQSQKLEAIGALAGGIAHDFNNILGAIIGYAELAMDKIPGGLSARGDLEQVLKSAHRAKELTYQILSFSRRTDPERKPLQMGAIVRETMKLLRASLPATIKIQQRLEPKAGPVLADSTQIHQLLMNLCTNAAHAMREQGGLLGVRLDRVEVDRDTSAKHIGLDERTYCRLSVSDTGEGMGKETLARVFEPFYTTKGMGEGTGMGLAVVHGIVKSHGGTITVHSSPGIGSTFSVYLPLTEEGAEEEKPCGATSIPGGTEHILFVDDEEALAAVARQMLERQGYRVSVRTSSKEALELFRERPQDFDVVITDTTMPQITGAELATSMLQIRPDIPIIICTGYSDGMSEEKAEELGIRRFLMKPLVAREVAEAVRALLDQK